MDQDAHQKPLENLAEPEPGPLPSADTLRDIVARYRRRRTRVLAIALSVTLLAGPALGFAVGRAGDHGSRRTVAAAGGGPAAVPQGAVAREDHAGVVASSGAAWAAGGPGGQPPPRPTRLFLRDTGGGIRVRAYLQTFPVGGETGTSPECLPKQFLQAEVSDDVMVGNAQAPMYAFTPDPCPVAVLGVEQVGDMEEDTPVTVVSLRVAANVALVKASFHGGGGDEMSPVDGWAILAGHGSPAVVEPLADSVVAFDATGRLLATVELSSNQQLKLPEACTAILPPAPILPPAASSASTEAPALTVAPPPTRR